MGNYLIEKEMPFKDNYLAKHIRNNAKESVEKKALIDVSKYKVDGSPGKGNWAEIPWIGVFDKNITTSAEKGYYIVYLFRADMSGFYLSLNQGWTYYARTYGDKEAREHIRTVAAGFKDSLKSSLADFSFDEIDLKSDKKFAVGYQLGHICGKFYSKEYVPDDLQLANDLRNLIGVYRELTGIVGSRSFEDIVDRLLKGDDVDDIEDEEYQSEVIEATPSITPKEPQKRSKSTIKHGKEVWIRNPKIAKESLEKSNYLCEIDSEHKTFTSSITDDNFVEAHHLIPMGNQDEFKNSLDVPGNIVSLCPNCHRRLHHASVAEKEDSIKALYVERKDDLKDYGIEISLEDLFGYYK